MPRALAWLLVATQLACVGPEPAGGGRCSEDAGPPPRPEEMPPARCATLVDAVTAIDVNGDGRPDIRRSEGASAGSCEELDLDFDGAPEVVRRTEPARDAVVEGMDFTGDGRLDRVATTIGGRLARELLDGDGDGEVDRWREYVAGELARVGSDDDGDGRPDRWTRERGAPPAQDQPATCDDAR